MKMVFRFFEVTLCAMLFAIFWAMTGTVSSKRYLKPVKLFIVGMSRKFDAQWIRAIEVVLEPTSHPLL
jgi:hypothetical protein